MAPVRRRKFGDCTAVSIDGKYASENVVAARHFSKELDKPLNESTVHFIKKNYYFCASHAVANVIASNIRNAQANCSHDVAIGTHAKYMNNMCVHGRLTMCTCSRLQEHDITHTQDSTVSTTLIW